jgi:hypothetical protein
MKKRRLGESGGFGNRSPPRLQKVIRRRSDVSFIGNNLNLQITKKMQCDLLLTFYPASNACFYQVYAYLCGELRKRRGVLIPLFVFIAL